MPHIHQAMEQLSDLGPKLVISSPWILFGGVFLVCSVGGIAALIKGKQAITWRMILSAALNSGLFGLGIALMIYDRLPVNLVLGVSVISGIGGASLTDAVFQVMRPKLGPIIAHVLTAMASAFTNNKSDSDK